MIRGLFQRNLARRGGSYLSISRSAEGRTISFNWKWFAKACAVTCAGGLACVLAFFSPLNRSLLNMFLFHPELIANGTYSQKQIAGVNIQDVYFEASDKKKLCAWYLETPGSHLTVLLSHGNGGNLVLRGDLVATLVKAGLSVLAYDYEGYGKSEGEPSVEIACDDAKCAYEYLVHEKRIPSNKIILLGESLGTGITGDLASKVKCAGVILQCPFMSLRQRAVEILPIEHLYPQFTYPANALDNVAVFSKPHAPLLIIAGAKDQVLPVHHADQLFKMAIEPKSYVRVEGAGHTGDPALLTDEYLRALKAFIKSVDKTSDLKPLNQRQLQS
jgi:fermentation-respiration switch protein FrsA (DUF1100 family)